MQYGIGLRDYNHYKSYGTVSSDQCSGIWTQKCIAMPSNIGQNIGAKTDVRQCLLKTKKKQKRLKKNRICPKLLCATGMFTRKRYLANILRNLWNSCVFRVFLFFFDFCLVFYLKHCTIDFFCFFDFFDFLQYPNLRCTSAAPPLHPPNLRCTSAAPPLHPPNLRCTPPGGLLGLHWPSWNLKFLESLNILGKKPKNHKKL